MHHLICKMYTSDCGAETKIRTAQMCTKSCVPFCNCLTQKAEERTASYVQKIASEKINYVQ